VASAVKISRSRRGVMPRSARIFRSTIVGERGDWVLDNVGTKPLHHVRLDERE
jgi:hypothetical protein